MRDPDDSPAAVPERIGAYRVERRLGRGGMGEVFLAWDDRLERRVAVKRVRHDAGLPPTQRERFRREARAMARLSHPAIVQVYDLVLGALQDLRTAAARAPSWKNLYWLAHFEGRHGHLPDAREHFAAILRAVPGNGWVLEELAQLELEHGDLERAERLYTDLARSAPRRSRFTDLGAVRYLRGRYAEAAEAFRQALAVDPDDPTALVNLGDTEIELGREREAQDLFRRAVARIEKDAPALGQPPDLDMTKAECLARLGRPREAAALVQEALRRGHDEADLLYGAALVYSLLGDRPAALSNARAALEKGKSPRWFTGSGFRPLLEGADLSSLSAAVGSDFHRTSAAPRDEDRSGSGPRSAPPGPH